VVVVGCAGCDVVPKGRARREGPFLVGRHAEVPDVGLVPRVETELDRGTGGRVVGELTENERRAERRAEEAVSGSEVDRVQQGEPCRWNDTDPVAAILVVPLV